MKRLLASITIGVLLAVAAPSPATASDANAVDPAVAFALEAEPGGVVLSFGSAVWPELGMRLDVLNARAVGSCATGSICAYTNPGLSGTRLTWTSCGSKSTAALGLVGSIANARSSGTLSARQGTTVRASAGANSSANVATAYQSVITNVYC